MKRGIRGRVSARQNKRSTVLSRRVKITVFTVAVFLQTHFSVSVLVATRRGLRGYRSSTLPAHNPMRSPWRIICPSTPVHPPGGGCHRHQGQPGIIGFYSFALNSCSHFYFNMFRLVLASCLASVALGSDAEGTAYLAKNKDAEGVTTLPSGQTPPHRASTTYTTFGSSACSPCPFLHYLPGQWRFWGCEPSDDKLVGILRVWPRRGHLPPLRAGD